MFLTSSTTSGAIDSKSLSGIFFNDSYNSKACAGVWGCFKYWKYYPGNPDFYTTYNSMIKSGSSLTIAQTGIINLDLSQIISAINSLSPDSYSTKNPLLPINESTINQKINLGSLTINSSTTLAQNPNAPLIEARSQFTNIENYYGSDYLFIKMGLTKEQFFAQLSAAAEKLRLEKEEEERIIRLAKEAEEQKLTEEEKKRRAAENEQIHLANQSNQKLLQPARFLGDSFTESKLLKEQLASIRKDALFLSDDEFNSDSEIKSLLDNTASEFSRLNLKLDEVATKGLTQSQINSLEKNVITFESMNLNGMNILVPKIYLSLKTREKLGLAPSPLEGFERKKNDEIVFSEKGWGEGSLATNSVIFAKGDLTLNSPTATLLNSGSIISGKDMMLNLASLRNQSSSALTSYVGQTAEIKSGGNLKITASGDFTNNSSIISRKDMMLNLASLRNQTNSSQAAEIKSSGNLEITALGDIENYRSTIQSAQNLILTSLTGDIKNLGSKILTTNDLRLTTLRGNIINSSLIQTNDAALLASNPDSYQLRFGDSARSSGNISSRLIETASITAKNIEINSANNFTNLAAKIETITPHPNPLPQGEREQSELGVTPSPLMGEGWGEGVESGGNISITAANDINITTLQLRNRTEERGGSKKKSWEKITDTTTNLASEVSSSGNISLNSNSDVNIIGADLTAADNLTITSTQNTNILAAQNTSFTSESSSKKGFSVSKSSGSGSSSLTNILANLKSENGDIIIASKGDTNIIGAKLNGGSDAIITSLGETNISSVTDQNSSYSYANKSRTGLLNHLPVENLLFKYIAATDLWGLTRIADNLTGGGYSNLAGNEKTRVNTSGSNQEIQTTNLTTNNNLQIQSNQNLNLTSTNLKSENGDIELASNQNINILAAQAISTSSRDEDGKTDRKKSSTEITKTEGRSTSSTLEANNITLTSANDITLQAAKLTARDHSPLEGESESVSDPVGGQVNITAANNLLITTAQDFSTSSETNKSKTTFAKSLGSSGAINSTITNTEIFIQNPIKLKLDAGNLIYAEYNSNSNPLNSPTNSTNSVSTASLAYLNSLDPAKAIYNPLTEIHQSYDQTNRSLTNTSQALIAVAAVAIAVGTGGIGTGISGAILTAGATTTGTIATTSATNASMNADGSVINQLKTTTKTAVKDTTSKESLQAIAISAAAAGLAQGAMQASGVTNATNGTNVASAPNTVAERITNNLSIGLQKAAIHSTSNIIATSAIKGQSLNQTIEEQGGGEKILLNTAMNAIAETGAKEIGIAAHAGEINKATQLTLHGIVGCAIGSPSGNCAAGAAGAIAGEIAGEKYFKSKLDENGIQVAKLDANGNQITDSNQSGRETIILNASSPEAYNQQLQTLSQIKFQTVELSKLIGAAAAIPFATANGKDDASAVYAGVGAARNSVENNSIKVWVQPVALGNYHTSVKIEPENQEKYANDKRFQNVDENGRRYATIGAGPDTASIKTMSKDWLGNLIAGETLSGELDGINRARDVSLSNKVWESQTLVPASIEDAYISKLFEANANYKSNLDYAFFPIKISDSYNSNSYTAGLLHAVKIAPPTLPQITTQTQWQDLEYPERSGSINLQYTLPQFQTPGYNKPVPIEYFGVKK